jgi:hypothetical protein
VAADDDVGDAERGDRVLDGRSLAAVRRAVGRHDVARVAQDEQLARARVGEQVRVDA